ncbi:hypothetical protein RHGRI_001378 [Rhododendron griersonianum]|uniref:Uncharacterized protein n=1 Tax=Rhododendron griersonianum TaxID=479676 RepID=A0AAV6LK14_9ERIC|nr:hypothetical protein RHGRI_001378 [Rhododendron griersonianum]
MEEQFAKLIEQAKRTTTLMPMPGTVTRSMAKQEQPKGLTISKGDDSVSVYSSSPTSSKSSSSMSKKPRSVTKAVSVMVTEVGDEESSNPQLLEEKVASLQEQLAKRDQEMSHLMERSKSLQAQVTGDKQKKSAFEEESFKVLKTKFIGGNGHFFVDPMSRLKAYFKKKRDEAITQVPCLNIIVISDEEEEEESSASSPIHIPDSPIVISDDEEEGSNASCPIHISDFPTSRNLAVGEFMVTPKAHVTLERTMASPKYSPIPPMFYINTPEYVVSPSQRNMGYGSYTELVRTSRKRLRFEDKKFSLKCQLDDEMWKHSAQSPHILESSVDSDFSPRYPSPARTYDGESVSSDHFDFSCNVISVDVNFQDADIQIRSCPDDDEKARVFARREGTNQAKVIVALKEEKSRIPQNYAIDGEHISNHPYPEWVEMVLFSRGYSIPQFPLYNGVRCPRRHLVHFLALCGNTIRSQALLLRQFVLSLGGWAADWYFSLLPNSIPDWDTMAERFYRRFYTPWPMELEMWEPLQDESASFQTYELLEGTAE